MRRSVPIFAVFGLFVTGACATTSPGASSECAVRQIDEVVRDPVGHSGKMFCGNVFAVEYGRTARILSPPNEMPPTNDLALLVASNTRSRLMGLSSVPQRFYVEARIDPMLECFSPSESGEECSPYRRPVVFHISSARRLTTR